MNLQEMMRGVARKMRADFEQLSTQFQHMGERGGCREETVSSFLRTYLPKHLDVVSGELFSTDNQSCHCDLIVIDRMRVPLLGTEDTRLVPIEGAYAVVEVKSNLDSERLDECLRKCHIVKGMPRDAYAGIHFDPGLQSMIRVREPPRFPLLYCVFAYTGIDPATLATGAVEHWQGTGSAHLIDSMVCLDKWVMCWGRREGDVTFVEPTRGPECRDLALVEAGENALLTFYLLNYTWLSQAACDPIDLLRYSGVGSFGPTRLLGKVQRVSGTADQEQSAASKRRSLGGRCDNTLGICRCHRLPWIPPICGAEPPSCSQNGPSNP